MDIHSERSLMYNRLLPNRSGITDEFYAGVNQFIEFAKGTYEFTSAGLIRCPCVKCISRCSLLLPSDVKVHLYQKGFRPNYWYWTLHGEVQPQESVISDLDVSGVEHRPVENTLGRYEEMYFDAARQVVENIDIGSLDQRGETGASNELPNAETQMFYDLLREFNQPV